MSKLSHDKLLQEIAKYGKGEYELVDDSEYQNLASRITVKCRNNHKIETCLADFRKASFKCPVCDKSIDFINPSTIPPKENNVYRLIAFDQATENFGLSIYDNGKLVFYSLYKFSGNLNNRLVKIKKFINDIVIQHWKPDFVVFEDIQYQSGILTYKILAMLIGIIEELLTEYNIDYECVSPNVWRKYAGTAGKDRRTEKMLSKALVKQKYNIDVNDDIAESILIGDYGIRVHKNTIVKSAFGR